MKNFLRITAGIYVVLIGLLMFLSGILSGVAGKVKDVNQQVLGWVMVLTFFLAVCFIAIGVGVIMRKNWARLCLLVLSVLVLLDGIVTLAATSFILFVKTEPQKALHPGAIYATICFLGIFLVAIPVYFLIFFTRKSIKEEFTTSLTPNNLGAPFLIKLLAITMVLGGLSAILVWPFSPFNNMPMPLFFGITLSKGQGIIYVITYGILDLIFGIGLYRLKYKAWVGTICLNIYAILATIATALTFNQEQYSLMMKAIYANIPNSASQPPIGEYRIMYLASAVIGAVILWYLFSRRKAFVK